MRILIDGDGCPVVGLTIKIAKKYNIDVIVFCDTSHIFSKYDVETIVLEKGADSVDFALVNKVFEEDIVVTQDYGLAAMVLAKKAKAINQNGIIYTNENINQLLFTRHINKKVRTSGGRVKGPKKRQAEDDIRFENALISLIEKR